MHAFDCCDTVIAVGIWSEEGCIPSFDCPGIDDTIHHRPNVWDRPRFYNGNLTPSSATDMVRIKYAHLEWLIYRKFRNIMFTRR
jgi:hypothetical protein